MTQVTELRSTTKQFAIVEKATSLAGIKRSMQWFVEQHPAGEQFPYSPPTFGSKTTRESSVGRLLTTRVDALNYLTALNGLQEQEVEHDRLTTEHYALDLLWDQAHNDGDMDLAKELDAQVGPIDTAARALHLTLAKRRADLAMYDRAPMDPADCPELREDEHLFVTRS